MLSSSLKRFRTLPQLRRCVATLARSDALSGFVCHLDTLDEVKAVKAAITEWQAQPESARHASLTTRPTPEQQQQQQQKWLPPLSKDALLSARRVVKIAAGTMPNSAFSAAADVLLCAVAAATGDSSAGLHALRGLEGCSALTKSVRESAGRAAERCRLLTGGDGGGDDDMVPSSTLNTAIAWGDTDMLVMEVERLKAAVKDNNEVPVTQLLLARALLAKVAAVPDEDEEEVSHALLLLESQVAACDASLAMTNNATSSISSLAFITGFCEQLARRDALMALHGLGLGLLAKKYHAAGKAISSEGLYRSALKELEVCSVGRSSMCAASKMVLNQVAEDYAALLDDWENRDKDAIKVREEHSGAKSLDLVLLDINPWSIL